MTQKVNVRVFSPVAKRIKTEDLKTLGNFKEILEMLEFDSKYPANQLKGKLC